MLGNEFVEGSYFPRQPRSALHPSARFAESTPARPYEPAIPSANHQSRQLNGPQVGRSGFMDYRSDEEAIGAIEELDSFLRASDPGPYPDLTALRIQDRTSNDRRRSVRGLENRPIDHVRHADQVQRAVSNPNSGVNPYRDGESRLGLRLRIRSLNSNRLPTCIEPQFPRKVGWYCQIRRPFS